MERTGKVPGRTRGAPAVMRLRAESTPVMCRGPRGRREFLRVGLAGLCSLSLPGLFRLRANAGQAQPHERKAMLVVWLHGGASHLETYDPKPLAPSEYRGPYHPITTRVPGLQLCELLPKHATIAKRCTMLRSLVHTGLSRVPYFDQAVTALIED